MEIIQKNISWIKLNTIKKLELIEIQLKANLLTLRLGNTNSYKLDEIAKDILNLFELTKTIHINYEIDKGQQEKEQ